MTDFNYLVAQFEGAQNLHHQGRLKEALAAYDAIILLKPDLEEAHVNKGILLQELQRSEEALRSFDAAIAINPDLGEAFNNRGLVLHRLGRPQDAIQDLDRAIFLKPDFADAYNNRGLALQKLNHRQKALESYDRAVGLDPGFGEAWSNRGRLLLEMNQRDAAAASCERSVGLTPRHVEILVNCIRVFQALRRFREARPLLDRLSSIASGHKYLLGALAANALSLCDWQAQEALCPRLIADCADGKAIVDPFILLGYFLRPMLIRAASAHSLRDGLNATPPAGPPPALRHDKIRVAYLSADFRAHATAFLMVDLFERHDRSRFELYGMSFGPAGVDEWSGRLARAFDEFHDVSAMSDGEVADLLRRLEIDIAVDLKGYTYAARPGIFVRRAAPVQVNYLGYPGTMASDQWDYIIADPVVLPHAEQDDYAEKIVHLPFCYQVNDPLRHVDLRPARREVGLPESGFVFSCFNNHWKITRPLFEIWMRLLLALPGSVLWLLEDSAADTLRREAEARGVAPSRLVFAPKIKLGAHLARLGLADLVLDTLPYNAHTTASDALWVGVPLVTCRGDNFAGRVAASLLSAIALPELITGDLEAYEALALALAQDRERLLQLRAKLAAHRLSTPLFDANRFRKAIEAAFETMIAAARRGDTPAGFDVPA